jgi:hypothetical protein
MPIKFTMLAFFGVSIFASAADIKGFQELPANKYIVIKGVSRGEIEWLTLPILGFSLPNQESNQLSFLIDLKKLKGNPELKKQIPLFASTFIVAGDTSEETTNQLVDDIINLSPHWGNKSDGVVFRLTAAVVPNLIQGLTSSQDFRMVMDIGSTAIQYFTIDKKLCTGFDSDSKIIWQFSPEITLKNVIINGHLKDLSSN